MQYSAVALLALAASASAVKNGTVAYTTEVHTAYTTVCPASTELTFNGVTYTATASTTLTITNCPCTVVKPVSTSAAVYCATYAPSSAVVVPAVYTNATTPVVPAKTTAGGSVGTTSAKASGTATPSTITASGANKAMAFSGASLAGLLGLAAYIL
ncbi:Clock-controlled protein [Lachnellula hyalina]|uniref:Clock-controlled protein n=1 Tax=Lachnellula hyalina TaxID=1316788 RepID=A0A8H8R6W4_9HELO|nr:Clock-controlled protein [Lachnellula hyalina]TVY29565.1 Clock-controlled protein [Lachnellula hyalina]